MFTRHLLKPCYLWRTELAPCCLLSTCKAVVQNSFGGSDVLQVISTHPVVKPSKKEVLIDVYSTSVNPLDCQQREGYGQRLFELITRKKITFPLCPGVEFAGRVRESGEESKFKPGDRVWGFTLAGGTWAETVCVNEQSVGFAPKSIPLHMAGIFPKVASTVSAVIKSAGLTSSQYEGKHVFINGGSGGVGTLFIQLLKAFGAKSIAVTCSKRNIELCKQLGATEVINYHVSDYTNSLSNYDIFLDCISLKDGDRSYGYKVLRRGGQYLALNSPMIGNTDDSGILWGLCRYFAWLLTMKSEALLKNRVAFKVVVGSPDTKFLDETARLIDCGKILPIIDSTYPLEQMKDAHDLVDSGRTRGKVNIVIKTE